MPKFEEAQDTQEDKVLAEQALAFSERRKNNFRVFLIVIVIVPILY